MASSDGSGVHVWLPPVEHTPADAVLGRVALPADEVVHSLLDSELRLGMLAEAVGKAGYAQLWVEREAGVVRRSAFSQYEQEL